jgi:spore maturation protein CgeB
MEYLMDHPEERAEMGLNGMHAVEKGYNWNAERQKLLDLYKGILKR